MRAAAFVFALSLVVPIAAQQPEPQLPPSEALQQALTPYNQARAQNDDLTEADRVALTLGMTRAAAACETLTAAPQAADAEQKQQLALARLCLFGQKFEPARATLVTYLAQPSPPEREEALILLVRAYVGLKDATSAGIQVFSLVRDYAYDAEIHLAADKAIAASEALVFDPDNSMTWTVQTLCEEQRTATMPLLVQGKGLAGKTDNVAASDLYADALRCEVLERVLANPESDEILRELAAVVTQESFQHTAEQAIMQAALARVQMLGQPTPVKMLTVRQLTASATPASRLIPQRHGQIVLVAATLWSPSATERIKDIVAAAPAHTVSAITSWAANTGGEDKESPRADAALREWQKTLPPQVRVLIIPDTELQAFHVDQYPTAIVISNGNVVSNTVISDDGAVRMALLPIQAKHSKR